jgi:hypothetical protein
MNKSTKETVVFEHWHDGRLKRTETVHNRRVYCRADGALEVSWIKGKKKAFRRDGVVVCEVHSRTIHATPASEVLARINGIVVLLP